MARAIAPFYYDEYLSSIDDAAVGRFDLFGQSATFESTRSIDWHHTVAAESDFHLWRMKLGHMGFICPMLVAGSQRHHDAVRAMLAGYREHATFKTPGCFSSYWFPYSVSHRILAVLSGYVLAYNTMDTSLRHELASFLRWNAGFVAANIEHELKNNHVERNLAALCFYYTCAESIPARTASLLDREVRRIIRACVLGDGLLAERSAMYQGLTVMAMDVFSKAPFLRTQTRELARNTLTKAQTAWATMTHPDGEIALFNDSWFGEVPTVSQVRGHFGASPVAELPDAGYARLESEGVFVLMDAGPIGPRWNPGHGHADFLAVEVDIANLRFVVDPGTFQYSTGKRRAFERSANSHNGPHRQGVEPVEYAGCFKVGRMSEAHFVNIVGDSVTGHLRLPDKSSVCRSTTVAPDTVKFEDTWSNCRGGAVRLTIPGSWSLVGLVGNSVAEFQQKQTSAVITVHDGAIQSIEPGQWSHHYLVSEPATIVTLAPQTQRSGSGYLTWTIEGQAPA